MRGATKALALVGVLLPAAALGDTVRLKSGDVVEGAVEDLGDRVAVTSGGARVSLRWTDVDVVLKGKTAKDVFAERRAPIAADDAKGLYALALWADRAGLAEERRVCLEAVIKADPEHAAARDALAQQKKDGRWLGGASLLEAKGFVAGDGGWVLREERESLARRAEAARGFLPPEKRAEELLAKSGESGDAARKFAIEALRGLDADALRRPALRALRRGEPAVRAAAASALGKVGGEDVLRPLITAAVLDRDGAVRRAAIGALSEIGDPDVVKPIAKAMWSESSAVRMNAAEALGAIGGVQSVEWVIKRVSTSGGPGGRNHFFSGTQLSYISDFDVEIAQAAQIGDPIVGTLREGVILDTRVISANEEWTEVERRVYYQSLVRATGRDFGQDAVAWRKWFEDEGRSALAAASAAK